MSALLKVTGAPRRCSRARATVPDEGLLRHALSLRERGSTENFNGLLRQYLPKGACMHAVTQMQCDHIANDLNNRPRKRFGFDTPAQLYHRN
jgi:hypothetical protein